MKKLKLILNDLAVDSFDTGGFSDLRATVQAHTRASQDYYCSGTIPAEACANTACGCVTQGYTCALTCMYDCYSKSPCQGGGGQSYQYTGCTCAGDGDTGAGDYSHGCVTETA